MGDLQIPYSQLELQIALINLDEKKLEEDMNSPELLAINECFKDKATTNKLVAESNGISVIDLINSPNYTALITEFTQKKILELVETLKDKGWDDKTAWGFVAMANGLLG